MNSLFYFIGIFLSLTQTVDNNKDQYKYDEFIVSDREPVADSFYIPRYKVARDDVYCPNHLKCSELDAACITCNYTDCTYGKETTTKCAVLDGVQCEGEREFNKTFQCRFCYQADEWEHKCSTSSNCRVVSVPRTTYRANCSVNANILCFGYRKFYKNLDCNWTAGYRWSTAFALSVTLGGFGVDRFYLGLWKEGIGKLFSFGGLGVWTIVDVILIATGYIGPADGSLYVW